jgi:lipopolysaccharide export system protein LptA
MKRHNKNKHRLMATSALALLLAAALARAADAPPAAGTQAGATKVDKDKTKDEITALPSASDFRPTGPVTISGDHSEAVKGDNSSAVYTGNVILDSDNLKMNGDRAEAKRFADNNYTVKVNGSPAHMSHAGSGPDNPPVTATAKLMTYDSRTSMIELQGDAVLTKGQEKTTAETIHYNVRDKTYGADRGDNSRVIMIFPPSSSSSGGSRSAAPAAPAPAPAKPQAAPQPQTPPSP